MTVLLCDAVSFGFGPVGKLLAVLAYLDTAADIVFIGSGSSAELVDGWVSRVVEVDTGAEAELRKLRDVFATADLFVNVMNPVSLGLARELGVRSLVIDSLFWMWDRIDPGMAAADCYCIQDFVGVSQRLAHEGHVLRNGRVVGPIVDETRPRVRPSGRQLLVNMGGLSSARIQHGKNLTYPATIGGLLERVLRDHDYDRVLFTGSASAMRGLAAALDIPRAEYVCLAHGEFLDELHRSSLILTSPGLTTTYEAMALDLPLAFLPPQNYSQYHNLSLLREAGVAACSVHWSDLFPGPQLGSRMPEDDGISAVLELIDRFRDDGAAQRRVVDELAAMVQLDARFVADQLARQRRFRSSLGENGARCVAGIIRDMLEVQA